MKLTLIFAAAIVAAVVQAPFASAVTVGDGGTNGAGNRFLQTTDMSGTSAGSQLAPPAAMQAVGGYQYYGIGGMKNFGSTDLTLRLRFGGPMPAAPAEEAVTTSGVTLAAEDGGAYVFFAISPASFIVLLGEIKDLRRNTTGLFGSTVPSDAPADVEVAGIPGVENASAPTATKPSSSLPVFGALVWLRPRRRAIDRPIS